MRNLRYEFSQKGCKKEEMSKDKVGEGVFVCMMKVVRVSVCYKEKGGR